jgi:hypothetical protein
LGGKAQSGRSAAWAIDIGRKASIKIEIALLMAFPQVMRASHRRAFWNEFLDSQAGLQPPWSRMPLFGFAAKVLDCPSIAPGSAFRGFRELLW